MPKNPEQPMVCDEYGTVRFKSNPIVRYLLDHGGIDMNHLARQGFKKSDQRQFAQLIGYSVSGYCDLSYVGSRRAGKSDQLAAKLIDKMKNT